jgi:hypothetical protein
MAVIAFMIEYRNHKGNGERGVMNGSRYREVMTAARTDGVGVALRRAFAPVGNASDEFTVLLQELDRKTQV